MKIGILTLPLLNNYGGILQAYALQKSIEKLDVEAHLISIQKYPIPFKHYFIRRIKLAILSLLGKKRDWNLSEKERILKEQNISINTIRFIDKYINNKTEKVFSSKELKELELFDAYIVGSDQVWRPKYTGNIYDYFLSFLDENNTSKKIAYAASFGTDNWEYSILETKKAKKLVNRFDSVSVRESSGVNLCKEYLGVNATHLLDPTMLLSKEEYINNLKLEKEPKSQGNLMVYILDDSQEKLNLVTNISKNNYKPFCFSLKSKYFNNQQQVHIPRIETWLKGFIDADFIITDSFHGTIFSIIFNKEFITLGNDERGMARFNSLLTEFNLQNRLITDLKDVDKISQLKKIDWINVNSLLEQRRKESVNFLLNNIKE